MMKRLLNGLNCKRGRGGHAMLEFALGSSVLLTAFGATFQFGYTFYRYNALATAVSDGARYASLRPYNSTTTTPKDDFKLAVRNMVVYGNPAGGTTPIAPGLLITHVNLDPSFTNSAGVVLGVPTFMTVSISGYAIDAIFATTTLTAKPKVTYPYLGIYSPY
jgi:Flp pilus assembly protein TadG